MRQWTLFISPELDGLSVEKALRRGLRLSVTRIKRAKFQPNGILLDGVRVNTATLVHIGQRLVVNLPEQEHSDILPTQGEVSILYEDPWLLAVNKPAGIPTHPCSGHYDDTLANRLTGVFQQRGQELVFRGVNRLDIDTSGLLIVAKSAESQEKLQALLHTDAFVRTYLALTTKAPQPSSGTVCAPIGPDPERRAWKITPDGKPAVTDYTLLGQSENCFLLGLRLHTGRTHQIRLHMASIGCPLAGDTLYGGQALSSRVALHSHRLALHHPFTGQWLHLEAPIPEDLAPFLPKAFPR